MNRRFVTIIIILCLVFSLFAGCVVNQSSKNEDDSSSPKTDEKKTLESIVTAPGELPIVTEPITLTIGLTPQANVIDYNDNYLTKRLEKDTGINIEFYFFPKQETTQKLELMVASGEELPDIILRIGISAAARYQYGMDGVIIPLNDYFDKHGHFFNVNSKKYMSDIELDLLYSLSTSPDGNMYVFPFYLSDITDSQVEALYINHDWLDVLDLDIPATTDELYDVLVAFRDKDPNGNKLRDEIPLVGYNSVFVRGDIIAILMNSFRYYSKYRFDVNDGIISPQFTDEAFREGLRYINKLYKEELISPLSFTQDASQLKAMIDLPSDQTTIVGTVATHPLSSICGFSVTGGYDKVLEYTCLDPLKGPNGVAYSPYSASGYQLATYITRDCEHPEAAFRLLDYMCDIEISLTSRRGEPGVDWVWCEEGTESDFSAIGINAKYDIVNNVWSENQNKHWTLSLGVQPPSIFNATLKKISENPLEQARKELFYGGFLKRYGMYPKEIMTNVIYTDQELNEINEIMTTIHTYVDETRVRFVTGSLDLDKDWEDYIKTLNDMGLERYIEVVQTAYTRMKSLK